MKQTTIMMLLAILFAGCFRPAESSSATPVPEIPEGIVLDGQFGAEEWTKALHLQGTFDIADGSRVDGKYPFDLFIGANSSHLLVAMVTHNIGPNPFLSPGVAANGDIFDVLLNPGDGELRPPADLFGVSVLPGYNSANDGYWGGAAWEIQSDFTRPSQFNDGTHTEGRWGRGTTISERTILSEYVITRTSSLPDVDGFQIPTPGDFRMAVQLNRPEDQPTEWEGTYIPLDHADVWPGDGYTPDAANSTATWLRLRFTE